MSTFIIVLLFFSAIYDFINCRIPNYCAIFIVLSGVIQVIFFRAYNEYVYYLLEVFCGFSISLILCIVLYLKGLFGAGDAKLLASLGAIFGPKQILILIATSIVFAGVLSLTRLYCHGELNSMLSRWYQSARLGCYIKPEANTVASGAVPMGGAILLATVFCEFYLF